MKLRAIPDPVLTPYPRKQKPDLKPLSPPMAPVAQPVPEKTPQAKTEPAPVPSPPVETAKPLAPGVLGRTQDGQEINAPFQPVDPLTALASPNPTLTILMLRQLNDMKGPMPDTSSGALAVMDKLETGLKNGQDVSGLANDISTHIMGDDEHNEVILRLRNAVDRERAMEFLKSRSKWEDFCHGCMRRGELNVVEGMAVMAYSNSQLEDIFQRMDRKMARGDTAATRESYELVERINRPTLMQNKEYQRKFDDAPPQEREILRKLGFKLENALAAKITTTTKTETVEIVQNDATRPPAS